MPGARVLDLTKSSLNEARFAVDLPAKSRPRSVAKPLPSPERDVALDFYRKD